MGRTRESKQADDRGRVSLGSEYANRTFLVEKNGDVISFRPACLIPEQEAWLYENEEALALVRKGLDQAQKKKLSDGPDLDDARRLASEIQQNDTR